MTREEAIEILEYRRCLICQTCHYFHSPFVCERCRERNCKGEKEALKMAIKALEAEPIKHGRWIMKQHLLFHQQLPYCSECDKTGIFAYDYCPHCGAKMDEVTE